MFLKLGVPVLDADAVRRCPLGTPKLIVPPPASPPRRHLPPPEGG